MSKMRAQKNNTNSDFGAQLEHQGLRYIDHSGQEP
jgi:hypothetical protein